MRPLFGRKQIFTDEETIHEGNVVDVLRRSVMKHSQNRGDIQYLYDVFCGKTDILGKKKEVRPEINHQVSVNRASEITTFKLGYGFGEPIQYIRRGNDETLTDDVNQLNEYMFCADKDAADQELAQWVLIGGIGNRLTLPGDEEQPFELYTLDPRYSFVVYHSDVGRKPVMGVKFVQREDGRVIYTCYTDRHIFTIENEAIVSVKAHTMGVVPMVEYEAVGRLGCYEVAMPLLNAINEIESNRLDDLEQYVNSFLAILGASMDEESVNNLAEYKMLFLPEGTDAKYLSEALRQADIQTMADSYYQAVLDICGVPNRNGGNSGGENGVATIYRTGWSMAESHMKGLETLWKKSEKRFLDVALRFVGTLSGTELKSKDIQIKFTRRNYEDIQTKSQVLVTMLANDKIHPELAFTHCGMFLDPEGAYLQSKAWSEEVERKEAEEMQKYVRSLGDDTVQQNRQND